MNSMSCPDCIAAITEVPSVSGLTGRPLPVVTVRHHGTCPWARRYVGVNGVTITGAMGIILHHIDVPADTDTPDAA